MNPVEAVVSYKNQSLKEYDVKLKLREYFQGIISPHFLEIHQLFSPSKDPAELEILQRIYDLKDDTKIREELGKFIFVNWEEKVFRKFSGFSYGLKAKELSDRFNILSFLAVAHIRIEDLILRCEEMGVPLRDLQTHYQSGLKTSRFYFRTAPAESRLLPGYDLHFKVNERSIVDNISSLLDITPEFPLPKESCEIKFGEISRFDDYGLMSGFNGTRYVNPGNRDFCDPGIEKLIRNTNRPFPEDMIFVQGGRFIMGRKNSIFEYKHQVELSDFYISKFPVTFEQYDEFCEETGREKPRDEGWGRQNFPVVNVSYMDAKAYCLWMTEKTGIRTELPTEAQWEFAARGGTHSKGYRFAGSNDYNEVGWPSDEKKYKNYAVGEKLPNELRLYDMTGNVAEWCRDVFIHYFYVQSSSTIDPLSDVNYDGESLKQVFGTKIEELVKKISAGVQPYRKDPRKKFSAAVQHNQDQSTRSEESYFFPMVIRGGRGPKSPHGTPLITWRGSNNYLKKEFYIGFRIVMYPYRPKEK